MLRFITKLFRQDETSQPFTGKPEPANVGAPHAPGYPPPPNGIPFIKPDSLLDKHGDILSAMRQTVGINDSIFENLYIPAINRIAEFLHLLPASESHHHRGAGGALRHAIEVAAYTARASESVMVGSMDLPVRRKQKEIAWRYAAFIAGLCHDIGKPVTDLTVHTVDGAQWNPMAEGIYEWGEKTGADYYYLSWQPNRHKMHEQFYSMLVPKIAGQEGMEYLGGVGHDAVAWVLSMNQAATIEQKKMYELVTKGDMMSVEHDLRTHAGGANVAVAGVNLEKVVQDVLQNRIRLGIWTANKIGGRIWKTEAGVFLVWPISGGEIIEDLAEVRVLGLPRNPESLLAFMIERGLAVRMAADGDNTSPTWRVRLPGNNGLVFTLDAIKLSEDSGIPAMLAEVPPIVGEDPAPKQEEAPVTPSMKTSGASLPAPAPAPTIQASAPPATASPKPLPSIDDMGPHGIILESLVADMKAGRKKIGEDYIRLNDGRIAVAYPEGLKGIGVEASTMMEWLEEIGMLETDPYLHDKKTHTLDGFNPPKRSRKAILLTRDATSHLGFNSGKPAAKPAELPKPQPIEAKAEPDPKPSAPAVDKEGLHSLVTQFVDEIKLAKKTGKTSFFIEEDEQGLYAPPTSAISYFLKRCKDKDARLVLVDLIKEGKGIKEIVRNEKKMLFFPRGLL